MGYARGVMTVGRVSGDGTSSLIGLSSFAGVAHGMRRTTTASGVDGVKTVGRVRGVTMSGSARGVKTVGRSGGDGTSSLIGLSSFAGAAHA